jgi:hypothetical protein
MGHGPASCWTLHPELMTWKAANSIDEQWETGINLGMLDVSGPEKNQSTTPPGLVIKNRFRALAEEEEEERHGEFTPTGMTIAGLDVWTPMLEPVNEVQKEKIKKLISAGKGKITIDSGAADSVLPMAMLPNEELKEGEAKKAGVKYIAANGGKMENMGEKRVRFKKAAGGGMNSIMFQVTDVGKPLAAVSKMLDQGNTVVFTRKGGQKSYVVNDATGEKIEFEEERGTFVMEVEFFEPEAVFTGPGK